METKSKLEVEGLHKCTISSFCIFSELSFEKHRHHIAFTGNASHVGVKSMNDVSRMRVLLPHSFCLVPHT